MQKKCTRSFPAQVLIVHASQVMYRCCAEGMHQLHDQDPTTVNDFVSAVQWPEPDRYRLHWSHSRELRGRNCMPGCALQGFHGIGRFRP